MKAFKGRRRLLGFVIWKHACSELGSIYRWQRKPACGSGDDVHDEFTVWLMRVGGHPWQSGC